MIHIYFTVGVFITIYCNCLYVCVCAHVCICIHIFVYIHIDVMFFSLRDNVCSISQMILKNGASVCNNNYSLYDSYFSLEEKNGFSDQLKLIMHRPEFPLLWGSSCLQDTAILLYNSWGRSHLERHTPTQYYLGLSGWVNLIVLEIINVL